MAPSVALALRPHDVPSVLQPFSGLPSDVPSVERQVSVPTVRSQRPASPVNASSERAVLKSPENVRQSPAAARADAAGRIIAHLRALYPVKTAECVAADTGLPVETVQTWIDRGSCPNLIGYLRLLGAYGPDFVAASMGERAPNWLTRAGQEAELARLEAERAAIERRMADLRRP